MHGLQLAREPVERDFLTRGPHQVNLQSEGKAKARQGKGQATAGPKGGGDVKLGKKGGSKRRGQGQGDLALARLP